MKMFSLIAHRGGIFALSAMLCPLPRCGARVRSRSFSPNEVRLPRWTAEASVLSNSGASIASRGDSLRERSRASDPGRKLALRGGRPGAQLLLPSLSVRLPEQQRKNPEERERDARGRRPTRRGVVYERKERDPAPASLPPP